MNRGEIRTEIRKIIRDTDSTNYRWSDATLNANIDMSHSKIASITKCIPYRYTMDTVANQAEYIMPDYFLEANEVLYLSGGDYVPLTKRTENDLDLESELWRSATGTPELWYQRINYIGLVPYPTVATVSGLRVDMARLPTAFTADSDIPFDDVKDLYAFHSAIIYDVAMGYVLIDRDDKGYALCASEYAKTIKNMLSQINNKGSETRMPNIYEYARTNNRRIRL